MANTYASLSTTEQKLKICIRYFCLWAAMVLFPCMIHAQTPCENPYNAEIQSVTSSGATISWTAPNPAPYNGYQYYITTNIILNPYPGTPTGSTSTNSVTFTQSPSNTNFYMWIRSRCLPASNSEWWGPIQWTTLSPGAGCPNAPFGIFPAETYTPQYTQVPEIITTSAFAGQYTKVNVIPNRQYIFATSVPTDYITITDANLGNVIAHGPAPLTYNSFNAGVIRYYINTNASCGTQQTARTRYITAQVIPSSCQLPQNLTTSAISSTGAVINWTLASGGNQCHYYFNTSGTQPTGNTTPSGSAQTGNKAVLTTLVPNTTYHYWVRSNCNPELSNWVSGGSFTTMVANATGCNYAVYGENPTTPYTPGCFGNTEIIATNVYAGEYSLVNVLPNKIYTFTSSVATDFITISDGTTPHIYASGTTPLIWSSGANTAQIRYLIHTGSTCGYLNAIRTKTIQCQDASTCAAPSAFGFISATSSSASFSWQASNPAPSNGYQYYYSTNATQPTSNTPPSGTTASNTLNLGGLNATTTYYLWVRSNCGTTQGNWVFGNSFSTVGASSSGCTSAPNGLYPTTTFVPACFGITENIVTNAQTGQYSNVAISSDRNYTFSSSLTSDIITITNADASQIYVTGTSPLQWSSGVNSGTMRFYIHGNTACAVFAGIRIKTIMCQAATACSSPSNLTATPSTNGALINWSAANPAPSNGYQYFYNTSGVAPVGSSTPSGTTAGTSATLSGLTAASTYYYWVRANCGSSTGAWIAGGSFTTSNTTFCNTAFYDLYPFQTFVPTCTNSNETIVTDAYAGEYSNITVSGNTQYTFTSSVATDYITITNSTGATHYASGLSPLVWDSATISGTIRYYLHSNASCGNQNSNRIKYIRCGTATACTAPTNLTATNLTSNSAMISFSSSSSPGATYDVYFSTNPTAPTASTLPANNTSLTEFFLYDLTPNTTYYGWIRSYCGSTTGAWTGFIFATPANLICNGARYGLFPTATFTPSCSGSAEMIVNNAYAGEFSNISIAPNRQYIFTSSNPNDFISITNASGTAILASGFTPLVWNSGAQAAVLRYYIHTNINCGSQNQNRIRSVACSSTLSVNENAINDFSVYPNPTHGMINISGYERIEKVEIINQFGQIVKTALAQSSNLQMDINNLSTGIYIVKVFSGAHSKNYKIIKD